MVPVLLLVKIFERITIIIMAHHKRTKKKDFVPKVWTSPLRKKDVSVSCWGEEQAEDIAFYVDWHARHPFCTTPRVLGPGEEIGEHEFFDELDPTKVYSKMKPRGDQPSDFFEGGCSRVSEKFRPVAFGGGANFDEVSIASHHEYTMKGGKTKTVINMEQRSLQDKSGDRLTIDNFDDKTAAGSIFSVGVETICNKSVRDYMSESHCADFESKQADILRRKLEQSKLEEETAIKSAIAKELARKAALEEMYVAQRWGMIEKKKVGPWANDEVHSKYTKDGSLLDDYNRQELMKSIDRALEKHHLEHVAKQRLNGGRKVTTGKFFEQEGMHHPDPEVDNTIQAHSDVAKTVMRYQIMTERIGGVDTLEAMSVQWLEYAEKIRKQNRKALVIDFSLDLYDCCERGNVAKATALLATKRCTVNILVNDEPLFMVMFMKAIVQDQMFGWGEDLQTPEYGDRKKLTEILDVLCMFGGDINCQTGSDGQAPIHHACRAGNLKLVNWILTKKDSKIRIYTLKEGETPLMLAAKFGFVEICARIMRHPDSGPTMLSEADRNPLSKKTALHYAANFGQTSCAMFLLRIGADKVCVDANGSHPGKLALDAGYFPTAQMILGFSKPPIDVTPVFAYLTDDKEATFSDLIASAAQGLAAGASKVFNMFSDIAGSMIGSKDSSLAISKNAKKSKELWNQVAGPGDQTPKRKGKMSTQVTPASSPARSSIAEVDNVRVFSEDD